MDLDDILIVGIAGGTASGKTTIAKRIAQALGPERCLLLSHDRYYYDVAEPELYNYDHPDALETALLVENLRSLRAGDQAGLPDYDFPTHTRRPEPDWVHPRPLVLVEGILVLEDADLRSQMDLKVWVDCPDDLRLARRIRRDVSDRGRNLDGVLRRWLSTVRPMHQRFVAPSRSFADLELVGVGLIEPLVQSVLSAVERVRYDRAQVKDEEETGDWSDPVTTYSGVMAQVPELDSADGEDTLK